MITKTLSHIVLGLGLTFSSGCPSEEVPNTVTSSPQTSETQLTTFQRVYLYAMPASLQNTVTHREREVIRGQLSHELGNITPEEVSAITNDLVISTYTAFDRKIQGTPETKQDMLPTQYEVGLLRTLADEKGIDPAVVSEQESILLRSLSQQFVSMDFCETTRENDYGMYSIFDTELSLGRFIIGTDSQKRRAFEEPLVKNGYKILQNDFSTSRKPSVVEYRDCLSVVQEIAYFNKIDTNSYETRLVTAGYEGLTALTLTTMRENCSDPQNVCGVPYTRDDICFLNALAESNRIDHTFYDRRFRATVSASYDRAIHAGQTTEEEKDSTLDVLFNSTDFPCERGLQ
jgi:hypothetical protein